MLRAEPSKRAYGFIGRGENSFPDFGLKGISSDEKPLFHSDRGFQYTNKIFKSNWTKPAWRKACPVLVGVLIMFHGGLLGYLES